MPSRPHEMGIDDLVEQAWRLERRQRVARYPRGRRYLRRFGEDIKSELRRRGYDVDLAIELDEQIAEVDGHADVWRVFLDADLLSRVVAALAGPFDSERITKVIGIESRGFLLGGAVAVYLGAGFVPVRKAGRGHLPGPKHTQEADPDYMKLVHDLRVQKSAIRRGDRLLLVDDWIESGSQAAATGSIVETARGSLVGTAVIVNQLRDPRLHELGRLHYLLRYFPDDAEPGRR